MGATPMVNDVSCRGSNVDAYSYNRTFLIAVKAVTLIFISGRGSAIPSAQGGIGFYLFGKELNTLLGPCKQACI